MTGVSMESAVQKNYGTFFWSMTFNAFCRLDMDDSRCQYITYDYAYSAYAERLYGGAKVIGDKLIFSPMAADHIAVYDTSENRMRYFPISINDDIHANSKEKFSSVECIGKKAYMIGCGCACIVQFDVETGETVVSNNWKNDFSYTVEKKKDLFVSSIITKDNMILAPACYENRILEFNADGGAWKTIVVPGCNNGFSGICFDGKFYWLSPMEGNHLVKWDRLHNSFNYIELPYNKGANSVQYGGCCYYKDTVLVQKAWKKELLIVREKEGEVNLDEICITGIKGDEIIPAYRPIPLIELGGEKLLASDYISGDLYEIIGDELVAAKRIEVSIGEISNLYRDYSWQRGDCISESDLFNLKYLIGLIG